MNYVIKNIIDNKKNYIITSGFLLLLYLFFIFNHYAADTYLMEYIGYSENAIDPYFYDGRFVMTVYLYILDFFKTPYYIGKLISWTLAFISLLISIIEINKIFENKSKNKLNIYLSIGLIANCFITEYYFFIEYTGIQCLAILLNVLAAKRILNYFETNKKINIVISILFTTLSTFCYQGSLSISFIIPLLFTFNYIKTIKDFIIKMLVICFNYASAAITCLVLTKLSGASRMDGSIDIIDNIVKVIKGTAGLLINTSEILPKYTFLILFIISFTLIIVNILKNKDKNVKFIYLLLTVGALVAITIFPHLLLPTRSIWMVARSNYALGSLVVLPICYYVIYLKQDNKYDKIFSIIIAILFLMQFVGNMRLANSIYTNNYLAKEEVININYLVNNYEEESGNEVKIIELYNDKETEYVYDDIIYSGDINMRAITIGWAREYLINKYSNNKYSFEYKDDSYKEYCENNNWNHFNIEQVKFENDKLYLCIY